MELKAKLKKLAVEMGADFFGIANLSPAQEAIKNLWEEAAAQFPRAISFGIALPHAIVDQQPNRFSSIVAMNYHHHAYDIINQRLDHIASRLSGIIQKEGNRSLPIPSTQEIIYNENLYGIFSHKMAARLAGLGWIGSTMGQCAYRCALEGCRETDEGRLWRLSGVCRHLPHKSVYRRAVSRSGPPGDPLQCPQVRQISEQTGENNRAGCLRHVPLYLPLRQKAGFFTLMGAEKAF